MRIPFLQARCFGAACSILLLTLDTGCTKTVGAPGEGSVEAASAQAELWFAGAHVVGLGSDQTEQSGAVEPAISWKIPEVDAALDVAVDPSGAVWAVGSGAASVYRLSADGRPDLILSSPALSQPGNLVFDVEGGLWVANRGEVSSAADGTIVRFDVDPAWSGTREVSPSLTLNAAKLGDFAQLGSISFDAQQHFWVTSFAGVLRYDGLLEEGGDVAREPDAVIEKAGYDGNIYFYGVAFDAAGDLWASTADGLHHLTSVSKFERPAELSGRASPPIAVHIIGGADELPAGGLSFDADGSLWFTTGDAVLMYRGLDGLSGEHDVAPALRLGLVGLVTPATNSHVVLGVSSR